MKYWRNKSALFLAIAFVAAPARLFSVTPSGNFNSVLSSIGLKYSGKMKYTLQSSHQVGNWDDCIMCFWKVQANGKNGIKVRLRAHKEMSRREADRFKDEEFARIMTLFDDRLAYPGPISKRKEVPSELKPTYMNDGPNDEKVCILYASKEMTYGVGSKDLAVFRSAFSFHYCESAKTLVGIEVFIPKDRYDQKTILEELDNFSCKEINP